MDRRRFLQNTGLAAAGILAGSALHSGASAVDGVSDPARPPVGMAARKVPDARLGSAEVTWRVHTDAKLVALTFDDGPMPHWTPMALDICAAHKVRATFNLVGSRVLQNPAIARRELVENHEVGNHTWSHLDLSKLDATRAYDEILRSHEAIKKVTGQEPRHLRPPFGRLSGGALLAAGQLGYDVVLWNLQMREQRYNSQQLVDYIVEETAPGTILLAHDVGKPDRLRSLRALPKIIEGVRAKGFEFVTVSELLASAGPPSRESSLPT